MLRVPLDVLNCPQAYRLTDCGLQLSPHELGNKHFVFKWTDFENGFGLPEPNKLSRNLRNHATSSNFTNSRGLNRVLPKTGAAARAHLRRRSGDDDTGTARRLRRPLRRWARAVDRVLTRA